MYIYDGSEYLVDVTVTKLTLLSRFFLYWGPYNKMHKAWCTKLTPESFWSICTCLVHSYHLGTFFLHPSGGFFLPLSSWAPCFQYPISFFFLVYSLILVEHIFQQIFENGLMERKFSLLNVSFFYLYTYLSVSLRLEIIFL